MWQMPFTSQNLRNSSATNCGPSLKATVSGILNCVNNCRRCWIVFKAVAIFIGTTSNHLEWPSMTTRNILPSKGPAKSMCNRIHGRVGQDQGCNGAVVGEGRSCWHSRHSLTICSISRSMPGHHTRLRARAFILETPGCPPSHSVTQQHTTIVYEELQSPNPKWS